MTLTIRDEEGRTLSLPREPQRIVSLVPSDSYNLCGLGASERLVGRTEYCVEPAAVLNCPSVGGTKNVNVEQLLDLKPDLIIANQEENRRLDIERLLASDVPLLLSMPKTVLEGVAHCERLLQLMPSLAPSASEQLQQARERCSELAGRRCAAVPTFIPIWMDPLMTVNGDTFISDVLELVGGCNVFADRPRRYPLSADLGKQAPLTPEEVGQRDTRYPRVTLDEVVARCPQLVLLPNEPHEFTAEDAAVFEGLDIPARTGHIQFCDGRMLMWYGLRAVEGLEALAKVFDGVRAGRGGSQPSPGW